MMLLYEVSALLFEFRIRRTDIVMRGRNGGFNDVLVTSRDV